MPSNHLVLCHPFSSCVQSYYSGLISFKIDWCDFQGTLKSLLQHRCGVASVLWCSSFFMVQHSHPYMTDGKTIALTISVSQSSHSVKSDSLGPHGLQHPRLPCSSPTPRVCLNSCPSSQWCHPTILSSVVPLLLLHLYQYLCCPWTFYEDLFPLAPGQFTAGHLTYFHS